jgi:glycosyltransferase A (GT-A) superfamily protein (DUF2064 family)
VTAVVVAAKECLPGRVKTRLARTIGAEAAALVAAASLQDTIAAVRAMPATKRVLLFDGTTLPDGIDGFTVMQQVQGGLDERLGAMFDRMNEPTLLLGMDTPQVTTADVAPAFRPGWDVDAWFGPATDGGFWALWLRSPNGDLVRGVPMSEPHTGAVQMQRLLRAGSVEQLGELRDVDELEDALAVAALVPDSRFAVTLRRVIAEQEAVVR